MVDGPYYVFIVSGDWNQSVDLYLMDVIRILLNCHFEEVLTTEKFLSGTRKGFLL